MINEYKYGMFKIDGKMHYEDIKLLGTKVRYWECRTREIEPEHIQDLLTASPEVLVIGLGAGGLIAVSDKVKDVLRVRGIKLVAAKNQEACKRYNELLQEGKKVAALLPARG